MSAQVARRGSAIAVLDSTVWVCVARPVSGTSLGRDDVVRAYIEPENMARLGTEPEQARRSAQSPARGARGHLLDLLAGYQLVNHALDSAARESCAGTHCGQCQRAGTAQRAQHDDGVDLPHQCGVGAPRRSG